MMPERFIQDASQQCTPVTRTRFVKKQVPVSVIDMTSTAQYNQFTATTGITLTPVAGTGQRPGQMIVQVPDDVAGTVTLDLPGGALAAGKQISVTTQVTTDGGQPMEVQLVQVPVNPVDENDLVILDRRTVRFDSDVKFDVAAVNGDNLQLLLKTTAGINMGYRVGTTQYQVVDDVQENYVVVVCNDDGEFGKDYRFGFNGQMKTNEIAGIGNHNTALFWEYDTRLGRRWNTYPKPTMGLSSYGTFSDNPVLNTDVLGDKAYHYNAVKDAKGNTTLELASVETVYKYIWRPGHDGKGLTGYHLWERVEDTKDKYIVATKTFVYIDDGRGNRRVDYTTESTYDSYEEAYANRDKPNDWAGPIMVGLANSAHAHRQGEAWGYRASGGSSQTKVGPSAEVKGPAQESMTLVGRWMSKAEYNKMRATNRMVEGAGGQTFVATGGPDAFTAAGKGSVYAEFEVPTNSLIQGGQPNWFKAIGPSAGKAMQSALQKQGGQQLPQVQNLSPVLKTK
jgi:hypothetical protein